MIPALLTAWDALNTQIPCILFVKRKRISLCGVVVSVSRIKDAGPIFCGPKIKSYVHNKKCVQNYVSIVVSTVQENSSQSRSFKNPQYLSLDFVGKTALRYICCHISLTSQKRYLYHLFQSFSKGVHLTVTNWHVYKDELKIRPSMRIYIFEV